MLKRKIYDKLVEWKNQSNGSTALLIDGARRVGKSYIAEEFAKHEYKSYVLIDFGKAPQDVSLEEAMSFAKYGNAVASLCVEKRGAIPAMPTLTEIAERL